MISDRLKAGCDKSLNQCHAMIEAVDAAWDSPRVTLSAAANNSDPIASIRPSANVNA